MPGTNYANIKYMQVTYRPLPLEEFDRVKPLYERLFPCIPYPVPEVASVMVAEVEGKVVGFWFIQLCAHGEPLGIDPEYKDIVSAHKLLETLHQTLTAGGASGMVYYICTTTLGWDEALQSVGFKPIGYAYSNVVKMTSGE